MAIVQQQSDWRGPGEQALLGVHALHLAGQAKDGCRQVRDLCPPTEQNTERFERRHAWASPERIVRQETRPAVPH